MAKNRSECGQKILLLKTINAQKINVNGSIDTYSSIKAIVAADIVRDKMGTQKGQSQKKIS